VLTQLDRRRELRNLQQSKAYYTTQLAAERKELEALKTNPATLEKYAREKYLMKKDGEELFIISENYAPKKEGTKN
jgi:cell division protein FtsB